MPELNAILGVAVPRQALAAEKKLGSILLSVWHRVPEERQMDCLTKSVQFGCESCLRRQAQVNTSHAIVDELAYKAVWICRAFSSRSLAPKRPCAGRVAAVRLVKKKEQTEIDILIGAGKVALLATLVEAKRA